MRIAITLAALLIAGSANAQTINDIPITMLKVRPAHPMPIVVGLPPLMEPQSPPRRKVKLLHIWDEYAPPRSPSPPSTARLLEASSGVLAPDRPMSPFSSK